MSIYTNYKSNQCAATKHTHASFRSAGLDLDSNTQYFSVFKRKAAHYRKKKRFRQVYIKVGLIMWVCRGYFLLKHGVLCVDQQPKHTHHGIGGKKRHRTATAYQYAT